VEVAGYPNVWHFRSSQAPREKAEKARIFPIGRPRAQGGHRAFSFSTCGQELARDSPSQTMTLQRVLVTDGFLLPGGTCSRGDPKPGGKVPSGEKRCAAGGRARSGFPEAHTPVGRRLLLQGDRRRKTQAHTASEMLNPGPWGGTRRRLLYRPPGGRHCSVESFLMQGKLGWEGDPIRQVRAKAQAVIRLHRVQRPLGAQGRGGPFVGSQKARILEKNRPCSEPPWQQAAPRGEVRGVLGIARYPELRWPAGF